MGFRNRDSLSVFFHLTLICESHHSIVCSYRLLILVALSYSIEYVTIPQITHPFYCRWTFGLFPLRSSSVSFFDSHGVFALKATCLTSPVAQGSHWVGLWGNCRSEICFMDFKWGLQVPPGTTLLDNMSLPIARMTKPWLRKLIYARGSRSNKCQSQDPHPTFTFCKDSVPFTKSYHFLGRFDEKLTLTGS